MGLVTLATVSPTATLSEKMFEDAPETTQPFALLSPDWTRMVFTMVIDGDDARLVNVPPEVDASWPCQVAAPAVVGAVAVPEPAP